MNSSEDFQRSVQKLSSIPIQRLRVLSRYEDLQLSALRRSVIFIHALWSGLSVVGLTRFIAVMEHFGVNSHELDLVVIDNDCLPNESFKILFGQEFFSTGGNGETIWVKNGQIVAREVAGREGTVDALARHTKALLGDH